MKKHLGFKLKELFVVIALVLFFAVPQISLSADIENISVPSNIQKDYGLDASSYMFLSTSAGEITSSDRLGQQGGGRLVVNVDNCVKPPVPIPTAAWLLGTGLVGLLGIRRKMRG
jgi:hypothetical protein